MTPRTIVRIALVQVLLIVLGYISVGTMLKFAGYTDPHLRAWYRWNPLSVFPREYTLLVLALPAAWTAYAVVSERKDQGVWRVLVAQIAALVIIAGLVASYTYASVWTHRIPLLIGRPTRPVKIIAGLLGIGICFGAATCRAEQLPGNRPSAFYGINEDPVWSYKPADRGGAFAA